MTNKKDFTGAFQDAIDNENPAMNILSKSDTSYTKKHNVGPGFSIGIIPERKSAHAQLLMKPSILKMGKQDAAREGISFNEYMHRLIIENHDRMKGE